MLEITNLSISIDGQRMILNELSLTLRRGEVLSVFGPSGSGKSTLLNVIAGFIDTDTIPSNIMSGKSPPFFTSRWFRRTETCLMAAGDIRIDGKTITNLDPCDRPLGLVLQKYGTYPHMTAKQNIAFPLICNGVRRQDYERLVVESAVLCGLSLDRLDQKARTLSGGESQRVAIAKMLVKKNAKVGLLDEPFSHLDQILRIELIELIRRLIDKQDKESMSAVILVSHDWRDVRYSDRILLLNARMDGQSAAREFTVDRQRGMLTLLEKPGQLKMCESEIRWIEGLRQSLK